MGFVVARRGDGLGTRLLTLLCARRLAEKLGYNLYFAWPSLNDPCYDYSANLLHEKTFFDVFSSTSAFFDTPVDFGSLSSDSIFNGHRGLSISQQYGTNLVLPFIELLQQISEYDVIYYDLPYLFSFTDQPRSSDMTKIKSYWSNLNLSKDVRAAFSSFSEHYRLREIPAIHMRRGDVATMIYQSEFEFLKTKGIHMIFQRYLPLRTAFDIVATKFQDRDEFVICSEDDTVIEHFRERFRGKKFYSTKGVFEEHSTRKALLDLMVLSAAKELISPWNSLYSECAAFVGTCEWFRTDPDVFGLVDELLAAINTSEASNKIALRTLVMVYAWKLSPHPTERKKFLLDSATEEASDLVDELMALY